MAKHLAIHTDASGFTFYYQYPAALLHAGMIPYGSTAVSRCLAPSSAPLLYIIYNTRARGKAPTDSFLLLGIVERYIATLAGAYSHRILHGNDEDAPIAYLARASSLLHSLYGLLHILVTHHYIAVSYTHLTLPTT